MHVKVTSYFLGFYLEKLLNGLFLETKNQKGSSRKVDIATICTKVALPPTIPTERIMEVMVAP